MIYNLSWLLTINNKQPSHSDDTQLILADLARGPCFPPGILCRMSTFIILDLEHLVQNQFDSQNNDPWDLNGDPFVDLGNFEDVHADAVMLATAAEDEEAADDAAEGEGDDVAEAEGDIEDTEEGMAEAEEDVEDVEEDNEEAEGDVNDAEEGQEEAEGDLEAGEDDLNEAEADVEEAEGDAAEDSDAAEEPVEDADMESETDAEAEAPMEEEADDEAAEAPVVDVADAADANEEAGSDNPGKVWFEAIDAGTLDKLITEMNEMNRWFAKV